MRVLEIIFCLALTIGASQAVNWALLVAGSNTWGNYRHQADICHAYQILKARGFPEDHIVVMMYDDIANNPQNPMPGKIINEPNGPDVYGGVKIDYKGKDVTPTNFLNILSGNKAALKGIGTGRVIESTKDDQVFVNFADHGGTGLLAFPSDMLYASDLEDTLRSMAQKKQFKQLLFYVEACEAGSMFDNILEENNNILVSTASARDESSYGYYCNEESMGYNCLGDFYSITWMQHMDQLGYTANTETIFHQYDFVRTNVTESHVQLYGDFHLGYDQIQTFFGPSNAQPKEMKTHKHSIVDSRDIPLYIARKAYEHAHPSQKVAKAMELVALTKARNLGDNTFRHIVRNSVDEDSTKISFVETSRVKLNKKDFSCYKNLIQEFGKHCFDPVENNYVLKHLYKFANLCVMEDFSADKVIEAMKSVCTEEHKAVSNMI